MEGFVQSESVVYLYDKIKVRTDTTAVHYTETGLEKQKEKLQFDKLHVKQEGQLPTQINKKSVNIPYVAYGTISNKSNDTFELTQSGVKEWEESLSESIKAFIINNADSLFPDNKIDSIEHKVELQQWISRKDDKGVELTIAYQLNQKMSLQ